MGQRQCPHYHTAVEAYGTSCWSHETISTLALAPSSTRACSPSHKVKIKLPPSSCSRPEDCRPGRPLPLLCNPAPALQHNQPPHRHFIHPCVPGLPSPGLSTSVDSRVDAKPVLLTRPSRLCSGLLERGQRRPQAAPAPSPTHSPGWSPEPDLNTHSLKDEGGSSSFKVVLGDYVVSLRLVSPQ